MNRTHIALAGLVSIPLLATHAASQGCDWTLEPTPNPATSLILFGLDAREAEDVWTVGSLRVSTPPFGFDIFNYAAHWDGQQWTQVEVPQPSTLRLHQDLDAVIALAEDDAIAVGTFNPDSGASQAQSVRWDGDSWELMDSPFFTGGSSFMAVGRAGADVWAAGQKSSQLPPPAAATFPLAARLDGDSWDVVFVPPLADTGGRSYNRIRDIEGASQDDAWGVGSAQEYSTVIGEGFGPAAMMVRWDGSQWSQYDLFPILASTSFSALEGLVVVAPDEAWAVGYDYDLARQQTIPLILHWDGSAWSNVPVPAFEHSAELRDIAARAADDIYAVGTQPDADGFPHALVLHYDGAAWTRVSQSEVGDFGTWFRAIDTAGDTIWAAGQANGISDGLAQRRGPCEAMCPPDLAAPQGQLDFSDVAAFLTAFAATDSDADFADPIGQFDFTDIAAFLTAFTAGCP